MNFDSLLFFAEAKKNVFQIRPSTTMGKNYQQFFFWEQVTQNYFLCLSLQESFRATAFFLLGHIGLTLLERLSASRWCKDQHEAGQHLYWVRNQVRHWTFQHLHHAVALGYRHEAEGTVHWHFDRQPAHPPTRLLMFC